MVGEGNPAMADRVYTNLKRMRNRGRKVLRVHVFLDGCDLLVDSCTHSMEANWKRLDHLLKASADNEMRVILDVQGFRNLMCFNHLNPYDEANQVRDEFELKNP